MTRQAEALTLEIEGEDGVWAPRGRVVAEPETRHVEPAQFREWFSTAWAATEAGWLSRLLHVSRGPTPISTAVRLVVRLQVRGSRLHRKWVAFSQVEKKFLERWQLPGARIEPEPFENSIRFVFSATELPLVPAASIAIWPCEVTSPLHCCRREPLTKGRTIHLG